MKKRKYPFLICWSPLYSHLHLPLPPHHLKPFPLPPFHFNCEIPEFANTEFYSFTCLLYKPLTCHLLALIMFITCSSEMHTCFNTTKGGHWKKWISKFFILSKTNVSFFKCPVTTVHAWILNIDFSPVLFETFYWLYVF